jgi:hypothetical protein
MIILKLLYYVIVIAGAVIFIRHYCETPNQKLDRLDANPNSTIKSNRWYKKNRNQTKNNI